MRSKSTPFVHNSEQSGAVRHKLVGQGMRQGQGHSSAHRVSSLIVYVCVAKARAERLTSSCALGLAQASSSPGLQAEGGISVGAMASSRVDLAADAMGSAAALALSWLGGRSRVPERSCCLRRPFCLVTGPAVRVPDPSPFASRSSIRRSPRSVQVSGVAERPLPGLCPAEIAETRWDSSASLSPMAARPSCTFCSTESIAAAACAEVATSPAGPDSGSRG